MKVCLLCIHHDAYIQLCCHLATKDKNIQLFYCEYGGCRLNHNTDTYQATQCHIQENNNFENELASHMLSSSTFSHICCFISLMKYITTPPRDTQKLPCMAIELCVQCPDMSFHSVTSHPAPAPAPCSVKFTHFQCLWSLSVS